MEKDNYFFFKEGKGEYPLWKGVCTPCKNNKNLITLDKNMGGGVPLTLNCDLALEVWQQKCWSCTLFQRGKDLPKTSKGVEKKCSRHNSITDGTADRQIDTIPIIPTCDKGLKDVN